MKEGIKMNENVNEGIIGFFDILGYKNYLDNNFEITELLIKNIKKIKSAEIDIHTFFLNRAKEIQSDSSIMQNNLNDINWVYLSDTIILYSKFKNNTPLVRQAQINVFCVICITLMRTMFDFGFPLRGAIDIGNFYFEDNLFAGKPIVTSYKTVQELDIAACVFGKTAEEFILERDINERYPLIFKYPIPLKSKNTRVDLTLNYLAIKTIQYPPIKIDFRQYILESFCKHNKTITPNVESKINNTEYYFHSIKDKFPELFTS